MSLRVVLVLLLPVAIYASAEIGYFSAIFRVEKLLLAERKMVGRVKQSIEQGGRVTGDLRSYVDSYDDQWLHPPRDDPLHIAHHPVGAYLLIKRLCQNHTMDIFKQAQNLIGKPNIMIQVPDDEDLEMSALALVRLQDVYELDINYLVRGQIVMEHRRSEFAAPQIIPVTKGDPILTLDLEDTLFIGDVAYRQEDYSNAIVWYSFTLTNLEEMDIWDGSRVDAMAKLAMAHSKMQQRDRAVALYQDAVQLAAVIDPDNQILEEDAEDALKRAGSENLPDEEPAWRRTLRLKSEQLCRLDVLKNQAPRRGLKCRYVQNSPYLYFSPAKMEVLHRKNPRLLMYHDVVNDEEAMRLRHAGFPKFERSRILDQHGNVIVDKFSVSERGELRDQDNEFVAKMSRRVGHITGLSTALPHGEPFLVMNYGLGGAIQQHLDYFSEAYIYHAAKQGNRMMTLMFYLSEVEAGGAVVFPEIDVVTPAVQNAALMIENIKKSGDFEPLSMHASCPVLIGSKWTAVKWIREFGNEFRRPCGLTPKE